MNNQDPLDAEADALASSVRQSLIRAIDSSNDMPISEHVLYSSYESYDNIMIEQRRSLDNMMSKLAECSGRTEQPTHGPISLAARSNQRALRIEFDKIENLMDKYDTIHDFSELMFDRIGQNLDDAAGLRSRDAQLVQATLEAAKGSGHRKGSSTSGGFSNQTHDTSSGASSSRVNNPDAQQTPQQHNLTSPYQQQQQQQQYRYNKQSLTKPNQVNSVVQSFSPQQLQTKGHYGGYLGKQQYGSPNQKFAMLENKSIGRPQNHFKDKVDNSYRPFEPLIKTKPNAISPLRMCIERDDHGNEYHTHPYEEEIQSFPMKPELLTPVTPIVPQNMDSTPITLVETVEQLEEMCRHIEAEKEFAVDVEHHSYRSFQGITCLLQISTRTQDFVIDTIQLRNELYRLNNSFTNPNIVKVFHGADCDILWLQRDFGVYVVNLFDTSRAAKLMKFAHLSLAFLMKHYCDEEPDKSYQLADWRERPLPLPMLNYARADTHFLLYIYDMLRNDLLEKGSQNRSGKTDLLRNVYERGREICLKRYEKPPFSETSHLSVLRKSRSTFNAKQMFAFKELYAWRDAISRELDESVGYVLPNNLMIRISEYLPREPQGITALCNPIPPTVKKYLSDIHGIILKAIDVPLDEASKVVTGNQLNVDPSLRSVDLDSIGHKQDIAHSAGMQESSVPNLLDKMHLLNCSTDERDNNDRRENQRPNGYAKMKFNNQPPSRLYNFLDASWTKSGISSRHDTARSGVQETLQKHFKSPYHRYVARSQEDS